MKIKIIGINPITDELARTHIVEGAERFFNSIKEPDTEIDFAWPTKGAQFVDQQYWTTLNLPYTLQLINEVDENVYDGVLIYCGLDPALTAAKERLKIPVVGLMQASLAIASNLGRRIGIIGVRSTSSDVLGASGLGGYVHELWDLVRLYGMDKLVVSIRHTSRTGFNCQEIEEDTEPSALITGRKAIEEDGVDVLIIGAGCMFNAAELLQEKLGIPVIDPNVAGLRTLEMLVKMRLSQSKSAFPQPNLEVLKVMT